MGEIRFTDDGLVFPELEPIEDERVAAVLKDLAPPEEADRGPDR